MTEHPAHGHEQLTRDSNASYLGALTLGEATIERLEAPRSTAGVLGGLDEGPAQPGRALLGDAARLDVPARRSHGRDEAGVGRQALGIGEAVHVSDLGEDQEGSVMPHPGQGAEGPDDRHGLRLLVDETGCLANLRSQDLQNLQEAAQGMLVDGTQGQRPQPGRALGAEGIQGTGTDIRASGGSNGCGS